MSASGMMPPTMTRTSSRPASASSLTTLGTRVRWAPGEQRQPDGVGVLLHDGLDHLLGRLVQAGVDHLEPGVTQRPGDDLGPAVVTVEAGLGHDHPVRTFHAAPRIRMPWPDARPGPLRPAGAGWPRGAGSSCPPSRSDRGLGPGALPLGADDHAAAPVVVHHLLPGHQARGPRRRCCPGAGGPAARPDTGGPRAARRQRTAGAKVAPGQVLVARERVVARAAPGRPRPDVLDQVRRHLGDEAARHGRLGAAPGRAGPGVRDGQVPPGPGDADVEEPALLLQLARLGQGAEVGEDPLLQPDHEDGRVLQALGRVQRHQRDPGAVAVELVGVRHQGHGLEEADDVVEVAGLGGQLGQVLDPPVGLVGVLGHQLGQVARPLGHQLHEVGRVDRLHQRAQLGQRLGELLGPLAAPCPRARPPRRGRWPR